MTTGTDHLRETLVSSTPIFDGRLLHVREDVIDLPSGRQGKREVVAHPGAVAIVAITESSDVVLVRQWRHPAGRALWELPAGGLEPGEDPAVCAVRELSEETGYTADSWTALGSALVAPGYSTELMHFYVAEDLIAGATHPDEDETLDVEAFSGPALTALVAAGEVDVKTIAGLALAGRLPQ